ncbi:phage head-tail connector protein [Anaerophilus nitritogenes]|uniref:phage head-tail connector protein n=1 Tax=Anaerophilus nitritogenes TaxID=2498136 RepID=UPI00101B7365|nr:phage head-tail connector protein [Anaerophilus nitritogenes]
MTQLEKLKLLLGITTKDITTDKEFILQFAIDKATDIIKNYCNISKLPEELNNIVLNIALDIYRKENLGSESEAIGPIRSIQEGDTTTTYGDSQNADQKGDLLKDYRSQLKPFRKLRW